MDDMIKPKVSQRYMEIKSRTWSLKDAEYKAGLMTEILNEILCLPPENRVRMEYVNLCAEK
jgi:hypothetical protein